MARARRIVGLDPDEDVLSNAAMIVPTRIAELIEFERFIADPARVVELHAMRIASKRLRYTLELLAPFYGDEFRAAIDVVKQVQERLGKIHDADVLVPELACHIRRILSPARDQAVQLGAHAGDHNGALGLAKLCRDRTAERERLHNLFVAEWAQLRETRFFEDLRRLVRNAALAAAMEADEPLDAAPVRPVRHRRPLSTSRLAAEATAHKPQTEQHSLFEEAEGTAD